MIKPSLYSNTSSKGQKIIAALFLVTRHLPETDPMRLEVRDLAVQLASSDAELRREVAAAIAVLLGAATLAGVVTEGNAAIIEAELKYFVDPSMHPSSIAALFPAPASTEHKGHLSDKRTEASSLSFMKTTPAGSVLEKKHIAISSKSNRQEKIVSYINERKSANIKDISSLFPDVSEKTIQRELGALVAAGKITKRGNKRWSIYLAV